MILEEMRASVFEMLAETPSSPTYWAADDVDEAINDGYMEISDATEWYERTTPIPLHAHQTYYDLRAISPTAPVLTPKRIFCPTPSRWLRSIGVRELDGDDLYFMIYPKWENVESNPRYFFLRSPFWMGVWPRPSEEGAESARLSHTAIPPKLVAGSSPGFPEEFHLGLVEYAIYDLLCQDDEVGLALEHWQEYKNTEDELRKYVEGRQSVDRVYRMGAETGA